MNPFGLPPTAGYDDPYGVVPSGPVLRPLFNPVQTDEPVGPVTEGQGGAKVIPFPLQPPSFMPPQPQPRPFSVTDPQYANGPVPIVGRDIDPAKVIKLLVGQESSGNYHAMNRTTSASGIGQWIDSTWNNYGGYPRAMLAPPAVQNRRLVEDISQQINKYNGDYFKIIAAHYLPAFANNPETWRDRQKIKGQIVPSVESYIRTRLRNTPQYLKAFDEYLNVHQ